jgi:hypothetical protein
MMKRERVRVARTMAMVMRVVGNKESEGGKAMVMATRMVGKWTATAAKRATAMAMKVVGKQGRWQ